MLEWNDYIAKILSQESEFDGISLSLGDDSKTIGVPPIIKASILMLDKMMENQGRFNILVFPERIQSIFIFTLTKLLYNINVGKIEKNYDPEAFRPGEKLKFGKAVVEFMGVEEERGKKFMRIRLADLEDRAPIDFFPLLQKTTAQRLSKYKVFSDAKKEARKLFPYMTADEKNLKMLADYKTHMDSSIFNMTSLINTKQMINGCRLCGQSVKDIVLIGQADYDGNVKNIGAGQLGGTPAIVLASDLYSISAAVSNGHPVQSVIIDGSNANALLSQMDALDELMRVGVPVTCVTDVVNSFDLQPFLDRGFNVWRWDETSITPALYDRDCSVADQKTRHCAQREVEYLTANGNEISVAIQRLTVHRSESRELSGPMLKLYDNLYSLSFTALRQVIPFDEYQLSRARSILDLSDSVLEEEKKYLVPALYEDYKTVVRSLRKVFTPDYPLPKIDALGERLVGEKYKSICIIVPERTDGKPIQEYWQLWCRRKHLLTQVYVMQPAEYYPVQCTQFSATIVTGWLKRAIMRKILYSFNTKTYTVLLYDYEKRWKTFDTSRWNRALDSSMNRQTIERSFSSGKLHISTSRFEKTEEPDIPTSTQDEYAEIEVVLKENKYRQYVANGGRKSEGQTVDAVPVNYVGGYLAFYQTGHKIISATNIIVNDADKIKICMPSELKMGDFVVVRETDRDLIKEMADIILEKNGKLGLRETAGKWREAFQIERLFYTDEEIFERLREAGCTKEYQTVRGWLQDEDVIAPYRKEDLQCIARVTGSSVLTEMLDQVFDAAQMVRNAHQSAGRILSEQLRKRIVDALDEYGDIDPFNIWEPIEMQVEGVGPVRILKIIDIGAPVVVDRADTNRLLDEE